MTDKPLDEMLKSELIEMCESLGLETDGTKAVLTERILEAQAAEEVVSEPEDAPEDCCDDEECTDSACAEEVVEAAGHSTSE